MTQASSVPPDPGGGLTGCSLFALYAEFAQVLPELGDAQILVQFDADGIAHSGRCTSSPSLRPPGTSSPRAVPWFGNRCLRDILELEDCCLKCMPSAIGANGGIAALFESQLSDLRHGLAEPSGSRLRSLYFARLYIKGPNRALPLESFRVLRDRVLLPGIEDYQSTQASLSRGAFGNEGFLMLPALPSVSPRRHSAFGVEDHGSDTDVESEVVCMLADRLVHVSHEDGLLVLCGQEHVVGPRRRRHGLAVGLTESLVGDRSSITEIFEIVGSLCDDARDREVSYEELGSWWEAATLLTVS